MYFLFLNLGAGEIIVIALFVLMFFGSKQIPEIMRGLGRATRQFKDAMNGIEQEVRSATNVNLPEEEKRKIPPAPEGTQSTAANADLPNAAPTQGAAQDGPLKDAPSSSQRPAGTA